MTDKVAAALSRCSPGSTAADVRAGQLTEVCRRAGGKGNYFFATEAFFEAFLAPFLGAFFAGAFFGAAFLAAFFLATIHPPKTKFRRVMSPSKRSVTQCSPLATSRCTRRNEVLSGATSRMSGTQHERL